MAAVQILRTIAPATNWDQRISTPQWCKRPLHCGIWMRPMTAVGQSRRANQTAASSDVRFTPESERWNGSNKIRTIRPFVAEGARNISAHYPQAGTDGRNRAQ